MAGGPGFDGDPDAVLVAIGAHVDDGLDVAAGRAFMPEFIAAA